MPCFSISASISASFSLLRQHVEWGVTTETCQFLFARCRAMFQERTAAMAFTGGKK